MKLKQFFNMQLIVSLFLIGLLHFFILTNVLFAESTDECNGEGELSAEQSALYEAVSNEDVKLATRLLKTRQNVNFVGPDGWQPLVKTVMKKNLPLVKLLLKNGADPNTIDCPGYTVLETAAYHNAIDITRILLKAGAKPNLMGTRSSPLDMAAFHGRLTIASLLIEHGADPNLPANDGIGWPPLFVAINQIQPSIVKLLLQKGANPNIQIYTEDTALFKAIDCGSGTPDSEEKQLLMVEMLIQHGANPNIKTRGWSPLVRARANGLKKIESFLKAVGAKE